MRNLVIILTFFLLSIIHAEKQSTITLEINEFNNIQYISAIDYASDSNMKQVFIENKEKLIIQYESKKIIFSPNSSYIIINEETYNLGIPVLYDGNEFWIPLNSFLRIVGNTNLPSLKLDSSEKFILLDIRENNILECIIDNKTNGTLIEIKTSKYFDESLLSASITRGGWLNINIVGGELDSLSIINNTQIIKPILRIRPIQLGSSAQLSFLLKVLRF